MDFLSSSQISRYENVIEEINLEHEKSEKLKQQIATQCDKIVIAHLAKSGSSEKISHVTVKVFSDLFSIFNLYSEELEQSRVFLYTLLPCENCKFYLFEIFIVEALQEKIKNTNCLLNISVSSTNFIINETFNCNNKVSALRIIPVPNEILESCVVVTLIFPFENNFCYIKLDSFRIDVSYHFQMIKDKTKIVNKNQKLSQLTNIYNNSSLNVKEVAKPFILEYSLKCENIQSSEFVRIFVKNCYHRLDLEMFSELKNESNNVFVIHFSTGIEKHTVVYDKEAKICQIKASLKYLGILKKFFLREFAKVKGEGVTVDAGKLGEDLHRISEDIEFQPTTDLCRTYQNVRKKISDLPF